MTLNKFGQSLSNNQFNNLLINKFKMVNNTLKYKSNGDLDVEKVKICNVGEPISDNDAANKIYVDAHTSKLSEDLYKTNGMIEHLQAILEAAVSKMNTMHDWLTKTNAETEKKFNTCSDEIIQIKKIISNIETKSERNLIQINNITSDVASVVQKADVCYNEIVQIKYNLSNIIKRNQ